MLLGNCSGQNAPQVTYRGVSFVGTPDPVQAEQLNHLMDVHANSIALMPFAYGKLGKPELVYMDVHWQWYGETYEGVRETALLAKHAGLRVMIKPQLWLDWGSFTGDQRFDREEDWLQFESDYSAYIKRFAALAEEIGASALCIGTELGAFTTEREAFWRKLIAEIRMMYSGDLVYAANWDKTARIPFWDALDYIGVDAYFPLSDAANPSIDALTRGWEPWLQELDSLAKVHDKRVIFTEWGYRSIDYAAKEPWNHSKGRDAANTQVQESAFRAMAEVLSSRSWFAGGFVWKWFPNHGNSGGAQDNRFTPQNKPAEVALREWYKDLSRRSQ